MIKRVWSSLPTFHSATFDTVGMNVVLANRGKDSAETESTNGLGKSTLLRIFHFALGSEFSREKVLDHPELNGTTFGIDFIYNEITVTVSRNTGTPSKIKVSKSFLADLDLEFSTEGEDAILPVETWRIVLAMQFIPNAKVADGGREFSPSFRDLAIYFIRLGKEAFIDPLQAFHNEKGTLKRLTVSYLLELNWAAQRNLQELQAERERVSAAISAVSEIENASEDSIGDLEADRVVLEKSLEKRQAEVASFNLRSDYHDLEVQLNATDSTLHGLINDNYSDRRLLRYYQESSKDAPQLDASRPVSILKDAGAVFNETTLRTLDEVSAFHAQVYRNRADFLASEVKRLKSVISKREQLIATETSTKSQLFRVLESSGALETLIELQRSTLEMSATLEALKAKIDERKRFDRRKDELTAHIGNARVLLKQDLDLRRELVDEAIDLFAEYTRFLYAKPGKLGIDVKDAGYKFSFAIDRQGSDGVDQMVVFCFDLMIATLRARRSAPFNTLVHDSSLFADVDPRQYGLALQLAARISSNEGFQYICCLNEGTIPIGHLGDLDLADFERLRLTDDKPEGRLLGVRLSPRDV